MVGDNNMVTMPTNTHQVSVQALSLGNNGLSSR